MQFKIIENVRFTQNHRQGQYRKSKDIPVLKQHAMKTHKRWSISRSGRFSHDTQNVGD